MSKKINLILKQVLEKVEPHKDELKVIEESLKDFLEKVKKRIKVLKINAEVFVGGSFAKNTVIEKDYYDVDIFLRFNKKYKDDEISKLTKNILKNVKEVSVIHGSRDYFRVGINSHFFIEVIPVIKISKSSEARNITDLSYSHVRYINKKMKSKKDLQEIKIAKAFCHANNCYGAESYIQGFSGYGLELLVYYYGSFLKFIRAVSTRGKISKKIVIDIEKHYRNKSVVLMDLNSSKLQSPIVLIDPTHKQRNALAALSEETFEKFKKECRKFLKTPSIKAFEIKKTDLEKIKKHAEKKNFEFILIEAKTNKQEGDVAGSKLIKFYRHLNYEIEKFFEIKNNGFNYNKKKSARYFFAVKKKKEILLQGPNIQDKKNILAFKKKHKNYFIKKNRIYAKEKIRFGIKEFIESWKKKNKKRIKEMYILDLKVLKEIS
ncbi:nucleotidyltransferase domain-containing protein [Candidatus Pacearchaeota archaeon]|nr:nucleotidyltransferase domain-containing protein [Candidatus Pacearchaeota archaeon]